MHELMTLEEVARTVRVPSGTLRYWRHTGTGGPRSFKLGRRVVYRRADVEAWIAEQYAATEAHSA